MSEGKILTFVSMRPVIVYFISGDMDGEHIVIMEEALEDMFPNRNTDIIHVDSEQEKDYLINKYNIEELDAGLVEILWNEVNRNDEERDI